MMTAVRNTTLPVPMTAIRKMTLPALMTAVKISNWLACPMRQSLPRAMRSFPSLKTRFKTPDAPAAVKSEDALAASLTASSSPAESLESELVLTLSPSAVNTANSDSTTASVSSKGDPNTAKQTAFSVEAVKFQSADQPRKRHQSHRSWLLSRHVPLLLLWMRFT